MTFQQHAAVEIADLVAELIDEVRTAEPFVRDPTGPWARQPHHARMDRWRTQEHGLLTQLDRAAVPGGAQARDDAQPRGKPGSRPPTTSAFELSCQIIVEAAKLRRDLRTVAGKTLGARQHVGDDLREIVGLVGLVDRDTASQSLRQVRSWVNAAKVTLGYEVRVATLGVACPYCGEALKVKSDASSDVWCPTSTCVDDDGYRHTWPRSAWVFLLDELDGDGVSRIADGAAQPQEVPHST